MGSIDQTPLIWKRILSSSGDFKTCAHRQVHTSSDRGNDNLLSARHLHPPTSSSKQLPGLTLPTQPKGLACAILSDSGCEAPMKEKHSGRNKAAHPAAEEL